MRVSEQNRTLPVRPFTGLGKPREVVSGPSSLVRDQLILSAPRTVGAMSPQPPVAPVETLPVAIAPLGKTDYYRLRAEDFQRRHPDLPVPSYYMGYGDKYVNRFTDELSPKLSPEGQAWLAQARVNLQVAIEDRRRHDPLAFDRLERDDAAFLEFAYDSHPKAYLDAGLEKLPLKDLVRIGLTPDVQDLATRNGLEQVVEVAAGLASKKAREYLAHGLTWKVSAGRE